VPSLIRLGAVLNLAARGFQVNGAEVDHLEKLPSFRHWCWYLALHARNETSCVVFQKDSYAVFWGDYQVKRYTS